MVIDIFTKSPHNEKASFGSRSFLPIWSHLLEKSLMENFIFCAVKGELSFSRKICYH